MTPDVEPILATSRELYGRAVYSHKTHERERQIWSAKVCSMNRWNIALTGATTVFAVIAAALQPVWALILTAVLAAATVCFAIWQSAFDPAGKESSHRVAAKELLWIREQFLLLIADCHGNTDTDHLKKRLEMLTRELTAVYKFTPDTSDPAYAEADRMIKSGHFTFSDDEIDAMLPTELRARRGQTER